MQSSSQSWEEFVMKSTLKINEQEQIDSEKYFGLHSRSHLYCAHSRQNLNPLLMQSSGSKSLKRKYEMDEYEPNPKKGELLVADYRCTCPEPMDITLQDIASTSMETSLMTNSIHNHSNDHLYTLRY